GPPHVIAEQLGSELVLTDRGDHPPEAAGQEHSHPEESEARQQHGERVRVGLAHLVTGVAGITELHARDVGHAVVAAELCIADVVLGTGGAGDDLEEDQRYRQRDDGDVHVADLAVDDPERQRHLLEVRNEQATQQSHEDDENRLEPRRIPRRPNPAHKYVLQLPESPRGRMRKRTMAMSSSAAWPMKGVVRYDTRL